ncbi:phosphoribosyltransferase [Tropicimonas isoalkanivorans]|uniref:Putative phosphoribosyl transferase n=1 Tax=Tropicimonas isoalkanivorans TaxID=441112 RepID=A0A1I1DES2_9RHOB|nr:phosphoribosyltransferase [Tropicimonas isoalkanivorans]SFB73411.1 putative phosphoribosyl transferase [Tropicimonas isoalkanivorans]
MSDMIFADRRDAGRKLAEAVNSLLARHPGIDDPVLLALPRGGVPVAWEVARAIGAPLDLVMVRKIGVPWQPELAAAAVVDGETAQLVINDEVVASANMTADEIEAAKAQQLEEIRRRRQLYLRGRAPVPVEGRDAIVIDDGVATGATTRAVLKAVRLRRPRSLTLAVPVAPPDTAAKLRREVDHLVCLQTPRVFYAIGQFYADFTQVSDAEVVAILRQSTGEA